MTGLKKGITATEGTGNSGSEGAGYTGDFRIE